MTDKKFLNLSGKFCNPTIRGTKYKTKKVPNLIKV